MSTMNRFPTDSELEAAGVCIGQAGVVERGA